MFNFNLVAKKKTDELLVLTMTIGFRVMFFAIALFVAIGLYSVQTVAVVPVIILVVSCLAGLYNEAWYFNKNSGIVEHRFGLLFLFKRKTYSLDNIGQVEVRSFARGSLTSSMSGSAKNQSEEGGDSHSVDPSLFKRGGRMLAPMHLSELNLRLQDQQTVNIEMTKSRNTDHFYKKAELLALFLEKPLIDVDE